MDYGKVLSRAWEITWRWKVLWILGFLASLASGGGGGGGPSSSFSGGDIERWTQDYLAPEAARSPREILPESDIYALVCTLYYAVTGKVPFPGGKAPHRTHFVNDLSRFVAKHVSGLNVNARNHLVYPLGATAHIHAVQEPVILHDPLFHVFLELDFRMVQ